MLLTVLFLVVLWVCYPVMHEFIDAYPESKCLFFVHLPLAPEREEILGFNIASNI